MVEKILESWRQSRFSCVSIAVSLAEIIVIWSGVLLVNIPGLRVTNLIIGVTVGVWIIGGIGSLAFAAAGLFLDHDRMIPVLAVSTTVVASIACLLPMTV